MLPKKMNIQRMTSKTSSYYNKTYHRRRPFGLKQKKLQDGSGTITLGELWVVKSSIYGGTKRNYGGGSSCKSCWGQD